MIAQQKQVKVRSGRIADEYLRVGWEMVNPMPLATDGAPSECLLYWPGDGPAVQPDWSLLERSSERNQRIA